MPVSVAMIAADIRRDIERGRHVPGRPLPSTSRLADEYGVSRRVVREALESLAQSGLLAPRAGSGWHVVRTLRTRNPSPQGSLREWAAQNGLTSTLREISTSWTIPRPEELMLLGRPEAQPVLRVVRLRIIENAAFCLERSLYSPRLVDGLAAEDGALDELARLALARRNKLARGRQHTIDAVAASTEDAQLLGLRRGGPLLRVRRQTLDAEGRVIEIGDDRYPPGMIAFRAPDVTAEPADADRPVRRGSRAG